MTFTCIRCSADTDNDCDICDDCAAEADAPQAALSSEPEKLNDDDCGHTYKMMVDAAFNYCPLCAQIRLNRAANRIEQLETALQRLVDDIHDYEKINNLAPAPGNTECWDSVAAAMKLLAPDQNE